MPSDESPNMQNDPIVEEVRRNRDAFAASFGYSLDAICEEIKRRETIASTPLAPLPPQSPISETKSVSS